MNGLHTSVYIPTIFGGDHLSPVVFSEKPLESQPCTSLGMVLLYLGRFGQLPELKLTRCRTCPLPLSCLHACYHYQDPHQAQVLISSPFPFCLSEFLCVSNPFSSARWHDFYSGGSEPFLAHPIYSVGASLSNDSVTPALCPFCHSFGVFGNSRPAAC